jgi:broad specificity phosphatase PhoE
VTSKADFTAEEWTRLERAPFIAGMAISLADPGGPIEAVKETSATLKTVTRAAESGGRGDLVDALARDVAASVRARQSPLAGFKPKGATAGVEILDEIRDVNRIVSEKATLEEADAFRAWLLEAAKEAAEAAKEGGFLGFHAERVSEGEQRMLDQLAQALGEPSS